MSGALGWDGSAPDIAASFLKVRLRRDGLMLVGCRSWTSASVQLGDAADRARRDRSPAADRAVEREALAGFPAAGSWLQRASAGPRPRA
jgi:hypothetical protein